MANETLVHRGRRINYHKQFAAGLASIGPDPYRIGVIVSLFVGADCAISFGEVASGAGNNTLLFARDVNVIYWQPYHLTIFDIGEDIQNQISVFVNSGTVNIATVTDPCICRDLETKGYQQWGSPQQSTR